MPNFRQNLNTAWKMWPVRLFIGGLSVLLTGGLLIWLGTRLLGTPETPSPFPVYPNSTRLEFSQPRLYSTCIGDIFGGTPLETYAVSKVETPILDFYREVAQNRGLEEFSGQYLVQEATPRDDTKPLPQTCFTGETRWHLVAANVVGILDLTNPEQLNFATRYFKGIPQNTVAILFLTQGIITRT